MSKEWTFFYGALTCWNFLSMIDAFLSCDFFWGIVSALMFVIMVFVSIWSLKDE